MFASSLISMLQNNLPVVLSAVVGGGVLLLVLLIFRGRRTTDAVPERSAKVNAADPEDLMSNRRNSVRREGPPVKIDIASAAFKNNNNGYVLDRSTGGLRIAMKSGMAPGSTLQIRASHAPDTIPWVTIIVRSCKDVGDNYELGCEFESTPPWNVLLLFG